MKQFDTTEVTLLHGMILYLIHPKNFKFVLLTEDCTSGSSKITLLPVVAAHCHVSRSGHSLFQKHCHYTLPKVKSLLVWQVTVEYACHYRPLDITVTSKEWLLTSPWQLLQCKAFRNNDNNNNKKHLLQSAANYLLNIVSIQHSVAPVSALSHGT